MDGIAVHGLSLSQRARQQVAGVATVAIAGVAYFTMIIAALHFLRPDLNPVSRVTSEYAVGPYGFLMTSAFFSMSMATFALVIGLYQGLAQPARSRIGLALFAMWGVGVLIAMIFPIDPGGAPQTISGRIHVTIGPLVFLCVTAATILASRRFNRDETWRSLYGPAVVLSLVILAGFIATFLSRVTDSEFGGLTQRIVLVALVTWMLLAAARLRSVALGSASA